jgi:DNA topoisomerase IB
MPIRPEAFLDIEASLADRLYAAWQKESKPLLAKIWSALEAGQISKAVDLANSINLTPLIENNADYIEHLSTAALLFGATRITPDPRETGIPGGNFDDVLQSSHDLLARAIKYNVEDGLRFALLEAISDYDLRNPATNFTRPDGKLADYVVKYSPNQPRDPEGRWTDGGATSEAATGRATPDVAGLARQDLGPDPSRTAAGIPRSYRRRDRAVFIRLAGEVEATRWSTAEGERYALNARGFPAPDYLELKQGSLAAKAFSEQITTAKAASPGGAAVYVYPEADYAKMRLFVTDDGNAGFAIKSDGDIVSLFNKPGGLKGITFSALHLAVQAGGRKLDAFDTVLPALYAKAGFTPRARLKWDDTQAPEGWSKDTFNKFNKGEPDVVFMTFDPQRGDKPYQQGEGKRVSSYDEAVALQESYQRILHSAISINKWDESKHPREPGGSEQGGQFTSAEGAPAGPGTGSFDHSLGIKRKDMPQIRGADMPEFVAWAEQKGVAVTSEMEVVSNLKPAQSEYNQKQVEQMNERALSIPITISRDGYVLDGTNRYVRLLEDNPKQAVNVRRIDLPAREALALMHKFPKVFSKDVSMVGATREVVNKWEEEKHPREPAGSERGGEFTSGGAADSLKEKQARLARARSMGFDTEHVWYHGTFTDFDEFEREFGNTDAYLGDGFYFSSDPHDVEMNYSSPEGPDTKAKIEAKVEELQAKWEDEHPGMYGTAESIDAKNAINDEVRAKFDEEKAITLETFLKMERPFDMTTVAEKFDLQLERTDPNDEDSDLELVGKSARFMETIDTVLRDFGTVEKDVQTIRSGLEETLMDLDVSAKELFDKAKLAMSGLYLEDGTTGASIHSGMVIKEALQKMGYDSIIMDASGTFPLMNIPRGTKHAIVLKPNNIRVVTAKFDPKEADSANIRKFDEEKHPRHPAGSEHGGEFSYANAYAEARATPAYEALDKAQKAASKALDEKRESLLDAAKKNILEKLEGHPEMDYLKEPATLNNLASHMVMSDLGAKLEPEGEAAGKAYAAAENYVMNYVAERAPKPSPFAEQANQLNPQTNTPEFKAWFEGSKVHDGSINQNPLVAFHGSQEDIEAFDTAISGGRPDIGNWCGPVGTWFGAPSMLKGNYDPGNAEFVASEFAREQEGSVVYPVYLSIKKPMEYEGYEDFQDATGTKGSEALRERLIKKGYDGIVIRNSMTDGDADRDDWVAFHPEQIKSAIGNVGKFDPKSKYIAKWDEHQHPRDDHGRFDDNPSDPENIAASLRVAGEAHAARQKRIEGKLAALPEGHKIGKWSKQTIAGDVFWTNGKKFLAGRQLLEEVGSEGIAKHIGHDEVYKWDEAAHPREPAGSSEGGRFASVGAPEGKRDQFKDAMYKREGIEGLSYDQMVAKLGDEKLYAVFDEVRAQEKAWNAQMMQALSMGTISVKDALSQGAIDSFIDIEKDIKPLPGELYHVTTDVDAVMREGLKTRDELKQSLGKGLGGGVSNTISFTTDKEIATQIKDAMLLVHDFLNDNQGVDFSSLINKASLGEDANKPYMKFIADAWGGALTSTGVPLQVDATMRGRKVEFIGPFDKNYPPNTSVSAPDRAERTVAHLGPGWQHEGDNFYSRPATEHEVNDVKMSFIKKYLFARENAGGKLDPLFFMTDENAFKAAPRDSIQTLSIKPKAGTKGYKVSSLGEWRAMTGDVVDEIRVVERKMELIWKYDPDQLRDDHGRWTDQGGGKSRVGTLSDLSEEALERIMEATGSPTREEIIAEADRQRIPSDEIFVSNERKTFKVGDVEYNLGGVADSHKKTITIYNAHMTKEDMPGMLAHEAMHIRYAYAIQGYSEEMEKMRADKRDVMRPDGSIRDGTKPADKGQDYTKEYPLHAAGGLVDVGIPTLQKSDGLTDYSRTWWEEAGRTPGHVSTAINETLAEMHRLKVEGGNKVRHTRAWEDFYRNVNRAYVQITGVKVPRLTARPARSMVKLAEQEPRVFWFDSDWNLVDEADAVFGKVLLPNGDIAFITPVQSVAKYDPEQERDPKGTPTGGQWSKMVREQTEGLTFNPQSKNWEHPTKRISERDQQRLRALVTPPGWVNVHLNPDETAPLQVLGQDAAGRWQPRYSVEWTANQKLAKFARGRDFAKKSPEVIATIERDMQDPGKVHEAAAMRLIQLTGIRIGGEKGEGVKHTAIGASTLKGQHVKVDGNKITLNFTGKSGVRQHMTFNDSTLASYLRSRNLQKGEQVFDTTDAKMREYFKSVAGDKFVVKDVRMWVGTATAIKELSKVRQPKNEKEFKAMAKDVATKVSKVLGNTPAMAMGSYIDPLVWQPWNAKFPGALEPKKRVKKEEALSLEEMQRIIEEYYSSVSFDGELPDWRDFPETALDPDDDEQDAKTVILMRDDPLDLRTKVEPVGQKAEARKFDIVHPFVSFRERANSQAEQLLQLVSGLHTSRLSAYGFTVEAEITGTTTYAISAQLDNRVCPVCEYMHGMEFEVEDAQDALNDILKADDPDDLRTLQPWPKQDEQNLNEMMEMTQDELIDRNWHIPPYHPNCRCLLVKTSDVHDITQTPSYRAANPSLDSVFNNQAVLDALLSLDEAIQIRSALGGSTGKEAKKLWNQLKERFETEVLETLMGTKDSFVQSGAVSFPDT